MIIGLTGTKASGKGEVSEFLKEKGFTYGSLSDRVREEAIARGIKDYNIKDLQDIGNELRAKHGTGVLAIMTLKKLGGEDRCVVDGIRNPGEIEELKKRKDFVLIAVDAPLKMRYKRLKARGRESDPTTSWKDFLKANRRDLGNEENDKGQQVKKCMEMADIRIFNESSTIAGLRKKLKEILMNLLK
jgi:dephospho-CoA kinase